MRAQERPVTIGRHDGRMAIVLDGLSAGDRVVTHPSDTVRDGARLRPRAER
jgi:HlyD family secretion protein